ncbi:MAG: twin-arginine translocation signal domain-containing protein, partial [Anaerolineales bacterium]
MTDSHKSNDDNKMGRRDFLKAGLASAVALVLGGLTRKTAQAATTTYYGLDSRSEICCSMPLNYYIGRGGQDTAWDETVTFDRTTASAVGIYATYTYWVLFGPDKAPKKTAAGYYAYGKSQAVAYMKGWAGEATWAPFAYAVTFFADIEPYYKSDGSVISYNGWQHDGSATSKINNRKVLDGFLDQMAVGFASKPGIYTTPALFRDWFGTAYRTSQAAVLWVSGCRTKAPSI